MPAVLPIRRDINAPGRDAKGIYFAVDFLKADHKKSVGFQFERSKSLSLQRAKKLWLSVAVILETTVWEHCHPSGSQVSVIQLEMMPKAPDQRAANNPWPEWPRVCKTDYGQEEAIAVFGHDPRIYQTTVKEFLKDKNGESGTGLITVKLEAKKDEKDRSHEHGSGRGQRAEIMDADLVLIAAGFLGIREIRGRCFWSKH